ncbi:MAG: hypothetical protein OXF66_08945 [Gammaproteobacteria bacterium]|nr:hypothetical protein [Gammaproteobacteria bacterium]MCY4165022.1 hypothetical protein [Gammaproteobacteria bacterium]MCY4254982.1 hypothetical protein [Gammaproteobacteria bacterium]MCY4340248.1 hypothetical protein [Gammaproteobacteria bacterium]
MSDPQYFDHPVLDHLVETVMQLGSELWATRRRLELLEKVLADAGALPGNAVELYMPSAEEAEQEAAKRDAFVRRLYAGFARGGEQQQAPPEP